MTDRCLCAHKHVKSLGRLYGRDRGPGVVRTTTEPDCPVHGRCGACGTDEWACYKKRWAKGFGSMLDPCCANCSHICKTARALDGTVS